MSEFNDQIELVRFYNTLRMLYDLTLEEYDLILEENEMELMELDEEFIAFFLNNNLTLETSLMNSSNATDLEEQLGFPLSLLPINFTGSFGIHDRSYIVKEDLPLFKE